MKQLKYQGNISITVPYEDGFKFKAGNKLYTIRGETPVLFFNSLIETRTKIMQDTGASFMFKVEDDTLFITFLNSTTLYDTVVNNTILTEDERTEYDEEHGLYYYNSRLYNVFETILGDAVYKFGMLFVDRIVHLVWSTEDAGWTIHDADMYFKLAVQFDRIRLKQRHFRNQPVQFATVGVLEGGAVRSIPMDTVSDEQRRQWALKSDTFFCIDDEMAVRYASEIQTFINRVNERTGMQYQLIHSIKHSNLLSNELEQEDLQASERTLRDRLHGRFVDRQNRRIRPNILPQVVSEWYNPDGSISRQWSNGSVTHETQADNQEGFDAVEYHAGIRQRRYDDVMGRFRDQYFNAFPDNRVAPVDPPEPEQHVIDVDEPPRTNDVTERIQELNDLMARALGIRRQLLDQDIFTGQPAEPDNLPNIADLHNNNPTIVDDGTEESDGNLWLYRTPEGTLYAYHEPYVDLPQGWVFIPGYAYDGEHFDMMERPRLVHPAPTTMQVTSDGNGNPRYRDVWLYMDYNTGRLWGDYEPHTGRLANGVRFIPSDQYDGEDYEIL